MMANMATAATRIAFGAMGGLWALSCFAATPARAEISVIEYACSRAIADHQPVSSIDCINIKPVDLILPMDSAPRRAGRP